MVHERPFMIFQANHIGLATSHNDVVNTGWSNGLLLMAPHHQMAPSQAATTTNVDILSIISRPPHITLPNGQGQVKLWVWQVDFGEIVASWYHFFFFFTFTLIYFSHGSTSPSGTADGLAPQVLHTGLELVVQLLQFHCRITVRIRMDIYIYITRKNLRCWQSWVLPAVERRTSGLPSGGTLLTLVGQPPAPQCDQVEHCPLSSLSGQPPAVGGIWGLESACSHHHIPSQVQASACMAPGELAASNHTTTCHTQGHYRPD